MEDEMVFYDYDGVEFNPDEILKPPICFSCNLDNDSNQENLCTLNRMEVDDPDDFYCDAYSEKDTPDF